MPKWRDKKHFSAKKVILARALLLTQRDFLNINK